MLEKISYIADQAATDVSRRQFIGRLGRTAAGLAAVLGSLLLVPRDTDAAVRHCKGRICPPGYPYCCKEYDTVCKCNVWYCSSTRC